MTSKAQLIYDLIIIIPVYNEENRIDKAYFSDFLAKNDSILLVFVNDGSNDRTSAILSQLSNDYPNALQLKLPENNGKAEAVRKGVEYALSGFHFQFIAYADADLSASLDELNHFIQIFEKESHLDIIVGSRVQMLGCQIKRNLWRHYFSRMVATLICRVLKEAVYDTQCGLKMFRKNTAEEIFPEPFISKWIFDVELLARYKKRYGTLHFQKKILECPLSAWEEKKGSKLRIHKVPGILLDLIKIRKKYAFH